MVDVITHYMRTYKSFFSHGEDVICPAGSQAEFFFLQTNSGHHFVTLLRDVTDSAPLSVSKVSFQVQVILHTFRVIKNTYQLADAWNRG